MILGLTVAAFTALHVLISLVAIAAGLLVLFSMIANRRSEALTAVFLATTVLTSVTGFFFHSTAIGPPHVVGVISLVVLAVALFALYRRQLAGRWRAAYVITAVIALYLNAFVGVVQAFQKIGPLHALAPKGTEPAFVAAQGLTLLVFAGLGYLAVRGFHPEGDLSAPDAGLRAA
ncbi:MAG: conserved rane protein of unknown function [Phenylobacterium sp.]|nr:conserved rane protein of unknown function [Phenylobacterium sp.]